MNAERLACVMLVALAGCVPPASARGGGNGDRTEEQVATRGGEGTSGSAVDPAGSGGSGDAGSTAADLPVSDAQAVYGTIDPATGRRTADAAVGQRLREPRRVEIQSGRLRQAPAEFHPEAGELPYGFRVQVAADADFARASREAARMKELLGGRYPVYLEFIDPYYKLRVGDFATQVDAQPALGEIRALGYADAWTVRTTIQRSAP